MQRGNFIRNLRRQHSETAGDYQPLRDNSSETERTTTTYNVERQWKLERSKGKTPEKMQEDISRARALAQRLDRAGSSLDNGQVADLIQRTNDVKDWIKGQLPRDTYREMRKNYLDARKRWEQLGSQSGYLDAIAAAGMGMGMGMGISTGIAMGGAYRASASLERSSENDAYMKREVVSEAKKFLAAVEETIQGKAKSSDKHAAEHEPDTENPFSDEHAVEHEHI
jgi:hypothetical protein